MATTRKPLSASADGLMVAVTGTATGSANTVHQAIDNTRDSDAVYFWAVNISDADARLTVEWGGAGDANLLVKNYLVPRRSPPIAIATGQSIRNSKVVKAFATVASVINLVGHVDRISQ
jgi:hypothetical protein